MGTRNLQALRSALQQKPPIKIYSSGERKQEETKTERKDCFRCNSLVLATNLQTTFFTIIDMISPLISPESFFCRMMQTSDLNYNPMRSSHLGKSNKHYRSRIFLMGRVLYCLVCLPESHPHNYYVKTPTTYLEWGSIKQQSNPPPLKCQAATSNLTTLGGRYLYSF